MTFICEQCKTELKSKPKTYYKKDLHFIKDLGYVKVSLNPKDLLGEMKEYRQLSEQNKDQIEVFFVPWDMLGIQRYLNK